MEDFTKLIFNKFLPSEEINKITSVMMISLKKICLVKSKRNVFVLSLRVKLLSTIIIQSVVRASKEFAAIEIVYGSRKFVFNKIVENTTLENNATLALNKNIFLCCSEKSTLENLNMFLAAYTPKKVIDKMRRKAINKDPAFSSMPNIAFIAFS